VNRPRIRIGTRASRLAKWQATWVADQLNAIGVETEIIEISTSGDRNKEGSIASLGLQGVFTKEIQASVLRGESDIAVHSLKDLPTEQHRELTLAAVPIRGNFADALVCSQASSLEELSAGAKVGSGSLRRQAQLRHSRPDLIVEGIRGNVETRLRKLDEGEFQAIVLASAGLERLGLEDRITEMLTPPRMLPAPGQGALGIECSAEDGELIELLTAVNDPDTRAATDAERSMLAMLHAGCSAPVGAWGRVVEGQLQLDGLVASLDGKEVLTAQATGPCSAEEELGRKVARELLQQGAERLITRARQA